MSAFNRITTTKSLQTGGLTAEQEDILFATWRDANTAATNASNPVPALNTLCIAPASAPVSSKYTVVGYPSVGYTVGNTSFTSINLPYQYTSFVNSTGVNTSLTMYSASQVSVFYYAVSQLSTASAIPTCAIIDSRTGNSFEFQRYPYATATSASSPAQAAPSATGNGIWLIGRPSVSANFLPTAGTLVWGSNTTGVWSIKPAGPAIYGGIVESVIGNDGVERLIYIGGLAASGSITSAITLSNIMASGSKVYVYNCETGITTTLADLPFYIQAALYRTRNGKIMGSPLSVAGTSGRANTFFHTSQSAYNNGNRLFFQIDFNANYTSYTVRHILDTTTTSHPAPMAIEFTDTIVSALRRVVVYSQAPTGGFIQMNSVDPAVASTFNYSTPTAIIELPTLFRVNSAYAPYLSAFATSYGNAQFLAAGYFKCYQIPLCSNYASASFQNASDPYFVNNIVLGSAASNGIYPTNPTPGLTVIQVPKSVSSLVHAFDSSGTDVKAFKLLVKTSL